MLFEQAKRLIKYKKQVKYESQQEEAKNVEVTRKRGGKIY